jgi:hypothetical protein
MKLFLPGSGFQDCLKIQSDLNKLSEWCDRNPLLLNVGKCKTITFSRSRHPVEFSYILGGTVLDWVSFINDLGVIMNKKMTFSEHVNVMVAKTFAMLGLIRRLLLEFRDPYTLHVSGSSKTGIRKLRVEPILWCSCWQSRTRMSMICHHMRTDVPFCILTPSWKDFLLKIGCVMFIFDVLSARVNSSKLLSVLDLNTPWYPTRVAYLVIELGIFVTHHSGYRHHFFVTFVQMDLTMWSICSKINK